MRAEVASSGMDGEDWGAPIGTVLEVLGWFESGGTLWAVWRDDLGFVHQIPASFLRMLPHVNEPDVYWSLNDLEAYAP